MIEREGEVKGFEKNEEELAISFFDTTSRKRFVLNLSASSKKYVHQFS